jgi:hypothetical protein
VFLFPVNLSNKGRYLIFPFRRSLLINQTCNNCQVQHFLSLLSNHEISKLARIVALNFIKSGKDDSLALLDKFVMILPLIHFAINLEVGVSMHQRDCVMFMPEWNHRVKVCEINVGNTILSLKGSSGGNNWTGCVATMNGDVFSIDLTIVSCFLECEEDIICYEPLFWHLHNGDSRYWRPPLYRGRSQTKSRRMHQRFQLLCWSFCDFILAHGNLASKYAELVSTRTSRHSQLPRCRINLPPSDEVVEFPWLHRNCITVDHRPTHVILRG